MDTGLRGLSQPQLIVGVVGNPNCGKTTLFNALTGAKQQVGNWPGVTVERKSGHYRHAGRVIEVVDLPGTYSLDPAGAETSLDETIARDYILAQEADAILNIVDASNLERNLYLTVQLLEMQVPMLVALNMSDRARKNGIRIDTEALAARLGCPVLAISAATGEGLEALREALERTALHPVVPQARVAYHPLIEDGLRQLDALAHQAVDDRQVDLPHLLEIEAEADKSLPLRAGGEKHICCRWLALKLLEEDSLALKLLPHDAEMLRLVASQRRQIEDAAGEDLDILIADSRYTFINTLVTDTVQRMTQVREAVTERIDRVVLNRVLGIPFFLAVMYLMFALTINLGGALVDFFDLSAQALFVDGLRSLLESLGSPALLNMLLADGLGGGVQVVATFIPILGLMYLFLSLLEYSGYMSRAAFVMDKFMQSVGLPGKSFVPLIVGFGCNVPAIMATRTLESRRDRILTMMMAPFMSCGARLPVYALFAAAFFPGNGQNLVFALYLLGIAAALFTGWLLKHTLLQGQSTPFIMELPPYHLPRARNVLWHTWERLKGFIFGAGQLIVPMVMLIQVLSVWSVDKGFGQAEPDNSVLSEVGRSLTPAFAPLGLREENWPATVGLLTGILAKETIVGTLDAVYTQVSAPDTPAEAAPPFALGRSLQAAAATIPANLAALNPFDPLGLGAASDSSALGVNQQVFGTMAARFDGQAGAFAYLLFVLLYFPCVASTAAIAREAGARWAAFAALWSTFLAYASATLYYQAATFASHPVTSLAWIASLLAVFGLLGLTLGSRVETKAH